jgi:aryl-phospho-beta-D-glucosidase BglC (GH1 family)
MKPKSGIIIIILIFILAPLSVKSQNKAHEINLKLGRGVNLGNCLEAPNEGEWGVTWKPEYFEIISGLGFNSVRLPVRWEPATRSAATAPYTITTTFFNRMDQIINSALKNKLMIIINMHHHDELFKNPDANLERFKSMWKQIATHYKNYSDSLVFELLNEPNGNLTAEKWNIFLREGIKTVREISPERTIEIGTPNWGGISGLSDLIWPDSSNLILTIHYYNPFQFTHQGATWTGSDTQSWLGTTWDNSEAERNVIINEFKAVKDYSVKKNIPVNIGEFGSYNLADIDSRERWTTFCSRFFEESGFSWNYWEFCSGFGFYDPTKKTLNDKLVRALLKNSMPPANPVTKKQIYSNDFSVSTSGISLYSQQGGAGTAKIENGAYRVSITAPGTEGWHVQVTIGNLKFEKGKTYLIEYDAWSENDRSMAVSAAMNKSPWTGYSSFQATLSKQKQSFSHMFRMNEATDNATRVSFDMGKSTDDIFIDNIVISEVRVQSIPSSEIKDLILYPNPFKSHIYLSGYSGNIKYYIYDLKGVNIINGTASESNTLLDLSYINPGTYFLRTINPKGIAGSYKILKLQN